MSKSIAQKTKELDALIAWFDGDEFALEEAPAMFEKARVLAAEIEEELRELENTITVLKEDFSSES